MIGYPWESKADAQRTIDLTSHLFNQGYLKTLQATICIPYPGTQLYQECLDNHWLKYAPGEWERWDMRQPVMTCPMTDDEVLGLTRGIYKSFLTPRYLARKLCSIRTIDDLKYLWRGVSLLLGHLKDFSGHAIH